MNTLKTQYTSANIQAVADFSIEEKNSLVKSKFGFYGCTYVAIERLLRDLELLPELKAGGFRYDPGWGFGNNDCINSPREFNAPQISGTKENLAINFTDFDRLTGLLTQKQTDIMYVHAYNPLPLQPEAADRNTTINENLPMYSQWNTKPCNLSVWEKINYEYAKHWKERGQKVKYYEIWNEPDLQPVFFQGSMEDFFEIYRYGVSGIKRADPDALVGGPVISFNTGWIRPFLAYVKEHNLALDFFSYHAYGNPENIVNEIREILQETPGFEKIDTFITEYNSFIPATKDFTTDGDIERYCAAARILHDIRYFLNQEDIKMIYWAQFDDPEVFGSGVDRCGLISLDGYKKASFNAFKIYADMPTRRNSLRIDCDDVEGMASSKEQKYCVTLWNLSNQEKIIDLTLQGMALHSGTLKLYRIDSEHASYKDNPRSENLEIAETKKLLTQKDHRWQGTIPAQGVVYLVIES